MKNLLILLLALQGVPAYCKDLIFKIVEEKTPGAKDSRFALPLNNQLVWKNSVWHCKALAIGSEWGEFGCGTDSGMSVSTRFSCARNNSFESSRSFRIADGKKYNVVFSVWCE